jgi:fatty-acyl-CoA synthase
MQEIPLSISTIIRHGTGVQGASGVWTTTADGHRHASYAEVGRRAARFAHALRERLDVDGDQRVGTYMWNNQEHLEVYLAVPGMGAVLHTLNIRLAPNQLAHIVNHAQDEVIVVDDSLLPQLAKALPELRGVRHLVVVGSGPVDLPANTGVAVHRYEDLIDGLPEHFDWVTVDENDAAAMCYTSGTTGDPKAVVYSHRSIYLHSMQVCMHQGLGLRGGDRALTIVPMFHAMAWGLPYAALLTGASLVLPDRFMTPDRLVNTIERVRPTTAGAVPTIWLAMLGYLDEHGGDLSSLREVVIGGSALPAALLEGFEQRHGVSIVHAWGMTETSPLGSVARPPANVTGERLMAYRLSQGLLPASVEGRLVDDNGDVLPSDGQTVGELEVRGPWVTASYYQDTETDTAANAEPPKFHNGWLRTGDIGTLSPDGYLTLTDRAKDVIKSGGEWISSVELENHLMAHASVREASVIGVPDPHWSERPLAVIVPNGDEPVDFAALRDFLAARVARWQVPERWTTIDAIPKTSVGKFDKKALRAAHAAGELVVTEIDHPERPDAPAR